MRRKKKLITLKKYCRASTLKKTLVNHANKNLSRDQINNCGVLFFLLFCVYYFFNFFLVYYFTTFFYAHMFFNFHIFYAFFFPEKKINPTKRIFKLFWIDPPLSPHILNPLCFFCYMVTIFNCQKLYKSASPLCLCFSRNITLRFSVSKKL